MLRIYDEFLEDETIIGLKPLTYKLHVSALIYCSRHLTDGEVSERTLKVLSAILGYPVRKHVTELVTANVWVNQDGGGYRVRNYLEINPDAATVKSERAKSRDRMRELRKKRASAAECSDERDGERSDAVPNQPLPVLPFSDSSKAVAVRGERPSEISMEETINRSLRSVS